MIRGGRRQRERGREQPADHQLGDRAGQPDHHPRRAPRPAGLDDVDQLGAEREDLVGVAIHDLADLGELEPPPRAVEQPRAERVLELAELGAHRRVRQPEALAGRDQPALAHGRPEVQQVVVVEPAHRGAANVE